MTNSGLEIAVLMHYVHNNKNFIEKMKTSAHKQLENIKFVFQEDRRSHQGCSIKRAVL